MAAATATTIVPSTTHEIETTPWNEALVEVQKLLRHVHETKGHAELEKFVDGVYSLKVDEVVGKAKPAPTSASAAATVPATATATATTTATTTTATTAVSKSAPSSDLNTLKKLIADVDRVHGMQAVTGFINDVRFALYCFMHRHVREGSAVRRVNLILIGLEGAGKSSLLYDLVLDEDLPTPAIDRYITEHFLFRDKEFIITNLGGRVSEHEKRFYNKLNVIIFVVDSTKPSTFPEAKAELDKVLANEQVATIPLIICANKCDQSNSASLETIKEALQFTNLSAFRPATILHTQVMNNKLFLKAVMQILSQFSPFVLINQLVCEYARPLTSLEAAFDWYFVVHAARGSI